jgi:hypothetical protein
MIVDPPKFYAGAGLLAAFVVVLVLMFLPILDGRNALNYMDSLYNSISKGSAYMIPDLEGALGEFAGRTVEMTLAFEGPEKSELAALLLERNGADVGSGESELRVKADLGRILVGCLDDSDELFRNNGANVEAKYGRDGKDVLFGWWVTLKAVDKELTKQKRFAEAGFVTAVKKKAVECAYNYRGIAPRKISDNIGVVLFSLVFYVVYTVWYGYAIILIFEGCGLRTSH